MPQRQSFNTQRTGKAQQGNTGRPTGGAGTAAVAKPLPPSTPSIQPGGMPGMQPPTLAPGGGGPPSSPSPGGGQSMGGQLPPGMPLAPPSKPGTGTVDPLDATAFLAPNMSPTPPMAGGPLSAGSADATMNDRTLGHGANDENSTNGGGPYRNAWMSDTTSQYAEQPGANDNDADQFGALSTLLKLGPMAPGR